MTVLGAPRIAIFTHDSYGLGHIRRSVNIIREVAARAPDAAILLVTGSPSVNMLRDLPPNVDYVKVPTVATSGSKGHKPSSLPVGLAETIRLRSRIIRETVLGFQPDLFLVDNFPLGARLELLPTLQELCRSRTKLVLCLRDIADPPEKVRDTWSRQGIYQVLDRYYDRILVCGMPEIMDVTQAFDLSPGIAAKVHYCGYVTAATKLQRPPQEVRRELGIPGPFVMATVGGGGDGSPLLQTFIEAMALIPEVSALAVTGELMGAKDRKRLKALSLGGTRVKLREFVSNMPSHMAAADVVIAMGGYNTIAEILALKARAIIVPRTWLSGEHSERLGSTNLRVDMEQLVRAQALEGLGLIDLLPAEELEPEGLAKRITAALENPGIGSKFVVDVNGIDAVTSHIMAMINGHPEGFDAPG